MAPSSSFSFSDSFHYRLRLDESDLAWLKNLDAQCFISTSQGADTYFEQVGSETFRMILRQDKPLGGLCLLPMGQWIGGQCVPMLGVASVGIAPEYRGQGAAIALMQSAIREAHERGFALSTLYPAAQQLYRQAGYGQAGTYCSWSIATEAIHIKPASNHALPLESMSPDLEKLRPIYQRVAPRQQGWCDRHISIWQQKTAQDENSPVYAYCVGSPSQPQGYVLFTQQRHGSESRLMIRDWVADSANAGIALWKFLRDHRSQVDQIRWHGGVFDPMVALLPEQTATLAAIERWMTRIVNLPLALEARGYPAAITADLHLQIHDPWIEENSGPFILTVEAGQGKVKAGGTGDLALEIDALASLYTSFVTPSQLQWQQQISGSESSLAIATLLFSGTLPALPDFF